MLEINAPIKKIFCLFLSLALLISITSTTAFAKILDTILPKNGIYSNGNIVIQTAPDGKTLIIMDPALLPDGGSDRELIQAAGDLLDLPAASDTGGFTLFALCGHHYKLVEYYQVSIGGDRNNPGELMLVKAYRCVYCGDYYVVYG